VPLYRALGGESVDDEEMLVRAPGNAPGVLVTTTARQLIAEDGVSQGAVVVFRDISERKHAAEELARRAQELTHANAELEAFAYSVSHDLRTPLRAMQGLGIALQEDFGAVLKPQAQDYLRRIVGAAKRMDALILDLLAYSRIGRGQSVHQAVDLDPLWSAVRDELGASQAAELTLELPLGRVWGNRSLLAQIATNLVANAVKFVAEGVKPRVEVRSQTANGRVRVSVTDNGIGIDPAHQVRIFGIFERLHGVEQYPGTGIGLALVKKAVESMNGAVGVESRLGAGSCFWFELDVGEVA
jgi:signal transduction histidine kinase